MKEAAQPLMDLSSEATVMPSPKQHAISVSSRPHVRIEVVTYEPREDKEGREYFSHRGRRVDLSVTAFLRIVKSMQFGHERTELTETLKAAGLWK
jgi:hypothetical protein